MKKLLIACALVASTSMVSFAQTATPVQTAQVQKAAETRAKMYQNQLGLTTQQYDIIYKVELDYANQEAVAKSQGGPGKAQAYQMELGRDHRYKATLTPEQYAKYDAIRPAIVKPTFGQPANH